MILIYYFLVTLALGDYRGPTGEVMRNEGARLGEFFYFAQTYLLIWLLLRIKPELNTGWTKLLGCLKLLVGALLIWLEPISIQVFYGSLDFILQLLQHLSTVRMTTLQLVFFEFKLLYAIGLFLFGVLALLCLISELWNWSARRTVCLPMAEWVAGAFWPRNDDSRVKRKGNFERQM